MRQHVKAWFVTLALDILATLVLAYLFGDAGTWTGVVGGGVALAIVAAVGCVHGGVSGIVVVVCATGSFAAPAVVVTTGEVVADAPLSAVVHGEDSEGLTLVPEELPVDPEEIIPGDGGGGDGLIGPGDGGGESEVVPPDPGDGDTEPAGE